MTGFFGSLSRELSAQLTEGFEFFSIRGYAAVPLLNSKPTGSFGATSLQREAKPSALRAPTLGADGNKNSISSNKIRKTKNESLTSKY